MTKIVWAAQAVANLQAIYHYIAKDSTDNADRYVQKMIDRIELLENFPLQGERTKQFHLWGLREIAFGNYRIFYLSNSTEVQIVAIHHAARQLSWTDLFPAE